MSMYDSAAHDFDNSAYEDHSAWEATLDEMMDFYFTDAEQDAANEYMYLRPAQREAADEYMDLWDLLDDIGGVVTPEDYRVLTLANLRRISSYYVVKP